MALIGCAEPREMQRSAATIVRIKAQGLRERLRRTDIIAELDPGFAKRKPGGRKSRRRFDRLRKQIGRGGKIAARRKIAAKPIAPVCN